MKTTAAAAALLLAATAVRAGADASAAGIIAVRAVDAVAVVVAADPASRTLTIRDRDGRPMTLQIPPEVPLGAVREGALVDVSYVEAEALTILKAGAVPTVMVQSVAIAPRPGRPAGLSARPRRVLGRIVELDRARRALTIVGADRREISLKVAPIVEGFDALKPGDAAAIEYTEATALSAAVHDGDGPRSPRL